MVAPKSGQYVEVDGVECPFRNNPETHDPEVFFEGEWVDFVTLMQLYENEPSTKSITQRRL